MIKGSATPEGKLSGDHQDRVRSSFMDTLQVNHDASISHDLFMERLDALTEKTLADIKAFSLRENIPYDQVGYVPLFQHSSDA
jgi:hypothetical protein